MTPDHYEQAFDSEAHDETIFNSNGALGTGLKNDELSSKAWNEVIHARVLTERDVTLYVYLLHLE